MKNQLLKHTLRVTLAAMALSAATTGFARKLTPDEAISRANEFQQATEASQFQAPNRISAHGNMMQPDKLRLAYTAEKVGVEKTPAFYVFNNTATRDGGFIIASGDDRLRPVLAVVDNGSFDPQNLPDNLRWWLSQYEEEINAYLSSPASLAAEMSTTASTPVDNYKEWSVIPYLVSTKWDQGAPYNNLCPMATSNSRSATGCVATAFAQIVNYHKYADMSKVQGTTKTYTTNITKTKVSYTFPEKFDFDKMLDVYSSNNYTSAQANAVAELMKACGVIVNMDYYTSSGAVTAYTTMGAVEYFGYDKSSRSLSRSNYQTSEWEKIIYNELSHNRPVIYDGQANNGGHAFVCDGYSGAGMFHINWGWSGISDGAYALSALNPGEQGIGSFEGGYNSYQGISIFVTPGDQAPDLPANVISLYDELKIVNSSKVKMSLTYTSATESTITSRIGLKLTDENGNYLKIASQANVKMDFGYAYTVELTPNFSGVTLNPGKYYLVASYKDSDSEWVDMPAPSPASSNRVLVTVSSDGSRTLSIAEPKYAPALIWNLENDGDFYMEATNKATLTVRNDGTGDYCDNLYGRLTNSSDSSQSFDFEITSGSIIPASLFTQFNVSFDMSGKNFTDGEWILQLGKKIFDNDSKEPGGVMVLFEGEQKITILPGSNGGTLPSQSLVVTNTSTIDKEWLPGENFNFTLQLKTTSSTPLQLLYKVYKRGTNTVAYSLGGYYNIGTVSAGTRNVTISLKIPSSSDLPAGLYEFSFYNNATKAEISERVPISMGGKSNNITYRLAADGSGARIASWSNFPNDVTIPESVTLRSVKYPVIGIGASIFQNSAITSAVIPESVKSIDKNAFSGTTSLENIYFYGGCPFSFAEVAFSLTNPDVNVYVNEADYNSYKAAFANITSNVYSRIDDWSLDKSELTIDYGEMATVKINRNVTSNFIPGMTIDDNYDKSVAEIKVAEDGNSITVIGLKAGTTGVSISLAQPNLNAAKLIVTVEESGDRLEIDGIIYKPDTETGTATVVGYVDGITTADIKSSVTANDTDYPVTSIGYAVFANCNSLTSVTIPTSVTSISDNAFANCSSLTKVYYGAENPIEGSYSIFEQVYDNATLYVPTAAIERYKEIDPWKNFHNILSYNFSGADQIPAEIVVLDKETVELKVGETATLTATVMPDNTTDKTVTWASSNSDVATVNADGVVTAVAVGEAVITATCGEATAECKVTVNPVKAESVVLDKEAMELKVGETATLTATVLPDNTTDETVTWASSDESVATVDADGVVTAIAVGEAVITATCGDVTAECKVTVIANSGIDAAQANEPVITLSPMTINVSGVADDCEVSVYTLAGQMIASERGNCSVAVANRGVYIVKVGSKTVKVSVTR